MLNLLLGLLISAIPLPAKPARYVTDNAAVLPGDCAAKLDQKLEQFEKRTSDQVIVYIDKKVPGGTTLEEMSAQAIREWGVGQKGKNNGAILFVFTEDRKIRIEVGYGLEGSLTDAKSKLITGTIMKPRLRDGDYAGAVEHGVDAILNTIGGGEEYRGSGRTVAEANVSSTSTSDLIAIGIFLVAIPLVLIGAIVAFIRTLIRNPRAAWSGGSSSGSSWSSSDSSSSFSDSGSSSDSSSDFSGGGGDGGGGGASDSW